MLNAIKVQEIMCSVSFLTLLIVLSQPLSPLGNLSPCLWFCHVLLGLVAIQNTSDTVITVVYVILKKCLFSLFTGLRSWTVIDQKTECANNKKSKGFNWTWHL